MQISGHGLDSCLDDHGLWSLLLDLDLDSCLDDHGLWSLLLDLDLDSCLDDHGLWSLLLDLDLDSCLDDHGLWSLLLDLDLDSCLDDHGLWSLLLDLDIARLICAKSVLDSAKLPLDDIPSPWPCETCFLIGACEVSFKLSVCLTAVFHTTWLVTYVSLSCSCRP